MKHLGANIQSLRKKKGLTLIRVSKATGIDAATLSRIENGRMTGTLQSHMAIAKALEVRLPDLYEKSLESPKQKPRADGRSSGGVFSHSGGSVSELLTSNVLRNKMMPLRLKLKGGSKTATEELPLGTERFVYVLDGRIQVKLSNVSHEIAEGESLYFNAALPHFFVNQLKTPSLCLIVSTPASL